MFDRLKRGISRSRESLAGGLRSLLGRGQKLDAKTLEEIEDTLLSADVGVAMTTKIIAELEAPGRSDDEPLHRVRDLIADSLAPVSQNLEIRRDLGRPFVILVVGVNGAGKTTTIAKIARRLSDEGLSVVLAAGDTFRAAAVEQLREWGERNSVPVISQAQGADSASVIFDALDTAVARGADVLIADTAGRLHTQGNLMSELEKIKRVLGKRCEGAPDETLLVLDATTGQNAVNQVQQFHQAIGVSGLALTKLDGSARGGIAIALAEKFALPLRFIGVGESSEDLLDFNAREFAEALLGADSES